MSGQRVVAFGGTPVADGCGVRTAILDDPDLPTLRTCDGRTVPRDQLEHLVGQGFVTRVDLAADPAISDGVVVYRWRADDVWVFPLEVRWVPCARFEVAYLSKAAGLKLLENHAREMYAAATRCLGAHRREEAIRYVRRGLMAVPSQENSPRAASLYALLYAACQFDAAMLRRVEREIEAMLGPHAAREALREGRVLLAPGVPRPAPRHRDTWLFPGSTKPPREAAARLE